MSHVVVRLKMIKFNQLFNQLFKKVPMFFMNVVIQEGTIVIQKRTIVIQKSITVVQKKVPI